MLTNDEIESIACRVAELLREWSPQAAIARLSPADIEAIAQRVAAVTADRAEPAERITPLTRTQAARYCGLTVRSFDRERKRLPGSLSPIAESGPLSRRWSRDTLDLYLFGGGKLRTTRRRRAIPTKSAENFENGGGLAERKKAKTPADL